MSDDGPAAVNYQVRHLVQRISCCLFAANAELILSAAGRSSRFARNQADPFDPILPRVLSFLLLPCEQGCFAHSLNKLSMAVHVG